MQMSSSRQLLPKETGQFGYLSKAPPGWIHGRTEASICPSPKGSVFCPMECLVVCGLGADEQEGCESTVSFCLPAVCTAGTRAASLLDGVLCEAVLLLLVKSSCKRGSISFFHPGSLLLGELPCLGFCSLSAGSFGLRLLGGEDHPISCAFC